MTIRCIYTVEPHFPATDQHPEAERYQVGGYWVDAIGGEPTEPEVLAVLNPPQPLAPLDQWRFWSVLEGAGLADTLWAAVDALPGPAATVARNKLRYPPGGRFDREDALFADPDLLSAMNLDAAGVDTLWRAGLAL
jgi:hypothetical protein